MDRQLALGIAAVSDVLIAATYAWVGIAIARRRHDPGARLAGRMFALWWLGIAATGLISTALSVLAANGASPLLVDTLDQLGLAIFAAALVGFASYIAYLFFGTNRLLPIIAIAYAALVGWSIVTSLLHPATSYHIDAWRPISERAADAGGPAPALMSVLLGVPILGGTLAYATLALRRGLEPATRRRVARVSAALFAWLAGATLVSLPMTGDGQQLVGRALVLASAWLILSTARPTPATRAPTPDARLEALRGRARELV